MFEEVFVRVVDNFAGIKEFCSTDYKSKIFFILLIYFLIIFLEESILMEFIRKLWYNTFDIEII